MSTSRNYEPGSRAATDFPESFGTIVLRSVKKRMLLPIAVILIGLTGLGIARYLASDSQDEAASIKHSGTRRRNTVPVVAPQIQTDNYIQALNTDSAETTPQAATADPDTSHLPSDIRATGTNQTEVPYPKIADPTTPHHTSDPLETMGAGSDAKLPTLPTTLLPTTSQPPTGDPSTEKNTTSPTTPDATSTSSDPLVSGSGLPDTSTPGSLSPP